MACISYEEFYDLKTIANCDCFVVVSDCPPADPFCPLDKLGYEAIRSLHAQIDDDKDGQVELAESDDVSTYY